MRSIRLSCCCLVFLSSVAMAQATFANSPSAAPSVSAQSSAVRLTPTNVNFGTQRLGKSNQGVLINVMNTGNSDVTISSIKITGVNRGDFSENNLCSSPLPPGGLCTVTVQFNPTAIGKRTATLTVSDNAPPSPQTASLQGTGTEAQLSAASLFFGDQPVGTASSPMTVILTNIGSTAMSISSISVTGLNAADFAQTNTCGASMAAGASCFITATFTPSATGVRSASISISDNGGGSPQQLLMSGTGT